MYTGNMEEPKFTNRAYRSSASQHMYGKETFREICSLTVCRYSHILNHKHLMDQKTAKIGNLLCS